jgi:broad specificity phosphatase PhoE
MNIGKRILENVSKNKEVISATIVGSYTENKNLDLIGDLDVVVICKKLSSHLIKNLNKKISKINVNKQKKKIIINPSFGPLKINSNKHLPVHLMIYDVESHIEHVCSSPFTCYDWERSNLYKGTALKNIFPVNYLQLRDFFNSRRSSTEYLKDLLKNRISIRNYILSGKKIKLKKKYVKINSRNRGEFVYHIINFLIINLYKFLKNKNIKLTSKEFKKLFLQITLNDKNLFKQFSNLKKRKEQKSLDYDHTEIVLAKKFIYKYNKFLNNIKKNTIDIKFIRHAKTKKNIKNIFLGSGSDPDIIKKKQTNKNNQKYDLIITSNLKRSISTSKFYKSKKTINKGLINEINYGRVEGMSYSQLKTNYPSITKAWKKDFDIRFPKGESTKDVKGRVKKFLNYLKNIKNKKKILIISHSFFIRVLLGIFLKYNLKKIYQLKIPHLKKLEFLKKDNKILLNIDRKYFKKFHKEIYD